MQQRRPTTRSAGRALADPAALRVVGPDHPREQRVDRLLDQLRRRSRRQRLARLRRLRVRLHDAAPAEPRGAGDDDDRPRVFGLGRLEGGALDAQLPAGHARLDRGRRQQRAGRAARARRHGRQHHHRRGRSRRPHRARHVPRVERHRGLPGGQLPPDPRQPGAAVAAAAHDDRRRDARRLRDPERRPRVQPGEPAALVPRIDRRHRERPTRAASPGRPATRSRRPTATCSISAGLLGAYSSVYALTDQSNAQVGGSQPALAYFDGDPFPVQNQTPTGAADAARPRARDGARRGREHRSAPRRSDDRPLRRRRRARRRHDRARHDALDGRRGVRAARAAHRAPSARLACSRSTRNTKPDAHGVPCPLDAFPPMDGATYAARLDQLIASLSSVFYDRLTTDDGHAYGGWDLAKKRPDRRRHAASTRTRRRSAACSSRTSRPGTRGTATARRSVFARLESAFYDPKRAHLPDRRRRHVDAGDLHAASLRAAPGGAARHVRAHRRSCRARRPCRRSSRIASRASTSWCSTGGTTATRTVTSSGPPSAPT